MDIPDEALVDRYTYERRYHGLRNGPKDASRRIIVASEVLLIDNGAVSGNHKASGVGLIYKLAHILGVALIDIARR